jgi:CRISPR-associated endonuclease/helicase Cas3
MSLDPRRFAEFFRALHGHEPFPWQARLLGQVIERGWPETLALPTASGKTACIDIAVYALACGASDAARRIFFVVDRRVIVDEAHARAREIAARLAQARDGVLAEVAEVLRRMGGGANAPLAVFQLRGGVYRDDAWARSPAQPTVICSTVDQLGSRLLFRSYGASQYAWPLHAGLATNDALVLLDEAHCAEPFRQTLQAIARYRQWSERGIATPFAHVVLSATPTGKSDAQPFALREEDRDHPVLGPRLSAAKPARLVEGKARTSTPEFAKQLAAAALEFAGRGAQRVAVIVNRVATAKQVFDQLGALGIHGDRRALFIGRMRPWDRDWLLRRWQPVFAARPDRHALDAPCFVVATQCLEVGANLDFDALVAECASLDALRQRFGRLFRLGRPGAADSPADPVAAIILPKPDQRQDDPIYGEALTATWEWLSRQATNGVVDLGVEAIDACLPSESSERARFLIEHKLVVRTPDAPVMLPAHLDAWVQTSPTPCPDPDPALFLHGPRRGVADVQVCWRRDLAEISNPRLWPEAVALLPPSSGECMAVPLPALKRWLKGERGEDFGGDVSLLGRESADDSDEPIVATRAAVLWRGPEDSSVLLEPADVEGIRPGDTLVLPASGEGWSVFGDLARRGDGSPLAIDVAEEVQLRTRLRPVLRLVPSLLDAWPVAEPLQSLVGLLTEEAIEQHGASVDYRRDLTESLRGIAGAVPDMDADGRSWEWLRVAIHALVHRQGGFDLERHPAGGLLLTGRRRLDPRWSLTTESTLATESFSTEDDSASFTVRVLLAKHLAGVAEFAERFASACRLSPSLIEDIRLAASLHDVGKADPRFQAWLRGGVPYPVPVPFAAMLAKSAGASSATAMRRARERAGYPNGGRHELLSVRMIEADPTLLAAAHDPDLVLHLVASHHGRCRPFAPVVADPSPQTVAIEIEGHRLAANSDTGLERLDSGVPDRFWALVRRYGWWGLAYLEAIHVLADHRRSEAEQQADEDQP